MALASVTSTVTTWIGDAGLYAVFALMFVDAIFPAASEVVMVYGGAVAGGAFAGQHVTLFGGRVHQGLAAYLAIASAGSLGYLVGSLAGWAIGDYGGRPLLERRGRWLHLDAEKLDRAEAWFERYGDWAVLLGRVTPVVRSFISIPAGVFRAPLARYTWLTAIGSAVWCFAIAGAGWALGASWERFHTDFRFADYIVVLVAVLGAAWLGWRLVSGRRRRASAYTDTSE
jgi:membrane protein DedA with SNARE-associated domain